MKNNNFMKIKNKSFSDKSKKWLKRHLEDEYVIKSSKDNFRSRAAYKLIEIIEKYKLLDGLEKALDIGSAPGSWSEVLKSRGKNLKKIVALDLLDMNPIRNVDVYKVDFLSDKCSKILAKYDKFDLIVSDISPNLSGNRSSDFLLSLELLENVVDFALKELKPGGNMVSKYFRSGDISEVILTCKKHFKKVTSFKPKSSRKESSEIYLVCLEKKSPID